MMLTKWFVPPLVIPAGLFILVVVVAAFRHSWGG
jgi:hypothetical protein